MRTTLTIDDDVLEVAKGLAERDRKTIGEVVSELARIGLKPVAQPQKWRGRVPLMPIGPNSRPATLELVNRLRDEEGL
jgi:hypothetical protein